MPPVDEQIDRYAENMNRMKEMRLTDSEAQIVAGYLASSEDMGAALDTVVEYRERMGN